MKDNQSENSILIKNAKLLRKNMTRQERHLWYDFLNSYEIKFYRQKIFNKYIVDFYCVKAHLAVEIDGSQHYSDKGIEYDAKRTEFLKNYDIDLIRFSNLDIDKHFIDVCRTIDLKVKENIKRLSHSADTL